MNIPNLIVVLFLFAAGCVFGVIASFLTGTFNHLVINKFMNESLFRNVINLFLILVFSFLGSMIGFMGIIGFAADESAGDIFPYYIGISVLVSILCSIGYYFFKLR